MLHYCTLKFKLFQMLRYYRLKFKLFQTLRYYKLKFKLFQMRHSRYLIRMNWLTGKHVAFINMRADYI